MVALQSVARQFVAHPLTGRRALVASLLLAAAAAACTGVPEEKKGKVGTVEGFEHL